MWITKELLKEGFEEVYSNSSKLSNTCDHRFLRYEMKNFKSKGYHDVKYLNNKDIIVIRLGFGDEFSKAPYAIKII